MIRRILIYRNAAGLEPYAAYVDSLKDREGAAKIRIRVTRAQLGNLGDHRAIGGGLVELRVNFGPGYRVYLGLHGGELAVLICAGDKGSQRADIRKARAYWEEFRKEL